MAMRAMIVIGLVTACAAAPRPAPRLMPRLTLATPARSVPVPTVAAAAAVVAPAAFAPAAWSLEGGAAWSATGALTAQVCCTGWLKATRPLALPAGGAVEVDAVAPCARGVGGGGARRRADDLGGRRTRRGAVRGHADAGGAAVDVAAHAGAVRRGRPPLLRRGAHRRGADPRAALTARVAVCCS
jgi:hypothetical protein